MDATAHLEAVAGAYEAAMLSIDRAAQTARERIDADVAGLTQLAGAGVRSPFIDVPYDEPAPYVSPPAGNAYNALVPDTPLVDSALAFDDAPLWQS
jgi:hypothetical protein